MGTAPESDPEYRPGSADPSAQSSEGGYRLGYGPGAYGQDGYEQGGYEQGAGGYPGQPPQGPPPGPGGPYGSHGGGSGGDGSGGTKKALWIAVAAVAFVLVLAAIVVAVATSGSSNRSESATATTPTTTTTTAPSTSRPAIALPTGIPSSISIPPIFGGSPTGPNAKKWTVEVTGAGSAQLITVGIPDASLFGSQPLPWSKQFTTDAVLVSVTVIGYTGEVSCKITREGASVSQEKTSGGGPLICSAGR
ncbi:hypothetical protein GCM10027289_23990 [Tsukamurella serpentis]